LKIDGDIFAAGLAGSNSSRTARQMSVATNWFLNNYVKIYATYERFTFSGSARSDENLVLFRTQLAF
jgi:hypothetical protein